MTPATARPQSKSGTRRPLALMALLVCACLPVKAQQAPKPSGMAEVRVVFFGAERGYAVGNESIVFLCVLRNTGSAPLPENTLRLHLYPVAGLTVAEGDIAPNLPAIPPAQPLALRWKLMPDANQGPLVASLSFERVTPNGGGTTPSVAVPEVALTVVPRLASPPKVETIAENALPTAHANDETAWVGNDLVGAQLAAAERGWPVLLLVGRETGKAWRTLATGVPLAQTLSAEEGQIPWWQTFRWRDSRAEQTPDAATLTLIGTIGTQWKAELNLTATRGSAALTGQLRLTALRPMTLSGIRFPHLLVNEETDALPENASNPAQSRIAAVQSRDKTLIFGLTWPSAPLPGWSVTALSEDDGNRPRVRGAEAHSGVTTTHVGKGESVRFAFRLFAVPPGSLNDALRLPPRNNRDAESPGDFRVPLP